MQWVFPSALFTRTLVLACVSTAGTSTALGSNAYRAAYREACDSVQADFSFFFDTGGRRRCYIAPERFYESSSSNPEQAAAQQLKPEMVGTTLTPTTSLLLSGRQRG